MRFNQFFLLLITAKLNIEFIFSLIMHWAVKNHRIRFENACELNFTLDTSLNACWSKIKCMQERQLQFIIAEIGSMCWLRSQLVHCVDLDWLIDCYDIRPNCVLYVSYLVIICLRPHRRTQKIGFKANRTVTPMHAFIYCQKCLQPWRNGHSAFDSRHRRGHSMKNRIGSKCVAIDLGMTIRAYAGCSSQYSI